MQTLLIGLGVVAVVAIAALGAAGYLYQRYRSAVEEDWEARLENGEGVQTFEPPDISLSVLDYFRAMRHLQKQRKAAKKGWVKWYRIGSNWQRPRWVKPSADGAGTPKVTADGIPYYFPRDAMTVDAQSGAWVAMHHEGESDPVNVSDTAYPGIPGDKMQRMINLEAESKPPGFLDSLFGGTDQQTLMYAGIGVLFLLFVAYRYSTGAM